jgi:hypothetical protein
MLKHIRSVTAVATLVTAVGLAGRASAQPLPLNLSINPTQGIRGDVVNAQVNTDDIAANCPADPTPLADAALNTAFFLASDPDLIQAIFGGPDPEGPPTTYDGAGWYIVGLTLIGIAGDTPAGTLQDAFEQTFALTFADIATQQPVGEISTFDPTTGMGSVAVPDVTPGPWAVAAACVLPAPDPDALLEAVHLAGQLWQQAGFVVPDDWPGISASDIAFYQTYGPQYLLPILQQTALGVALFTIQTPTLGFTIDPTQGFPGDTVNGQVDTDDIDQYCVTDPQEFQDSFEALFEGPYAFGAEEGELFDTFYPGGTFVYENYNQTAYVLTGLVVLGIGADVNGAAADAFPQTFVMTFADLLTQEPLGPLGHFDPVTGMGSVVVPDLAPGPYPVAATCVRPTMDLNLLIAGIEANGAFLESIGAPIDINDPEFEQFAKDYLGDPNATGFDFLFAIGPTLIQNIVEIRALGVQFYTVLAHLHHFQCYRARTTGFNKMPITLADRFGTRSVTVRKPVDLCAPADKNGEDPEAPDSPFFLTSYKISGSGPFTQIAPVHAENQFGPIALKIKKPKTILVPTGVTTNGPPSSPDGAFLNHFTCYKARAVSPPNAPTPGLITVQTAFETVQIQPKKPRSLCVPASKNGGPIIPSGPENLLCYKPKAAGGLPAPAPVVFLANQFGDQTQRLGKHSDVCIPTDLLE